MTDSQTEPHNHTRKVHDHSHTLERKNGPPTPSEGTHNSSHTTTVICTQPYRHQDIHTITVTAVTMTQPHTHHQSDTHDDSHTMTATEDRHTYTTRTLQKPHNDSYTDIQRRLHNHTLTHNDNHTITVTLITTAWLLKPGVPSLHSPPPSWSPSSSSPPPLPLPTLYPQGTRPAGTEPGPDGQTEGRGSKTGQRRHRGRPKLLLLTGSGLLPPEPRLRLDVTGAAGPTD